jgi:uncharacterized membrane protein YraQ (UPF0718 family)
MNVLFEFLIVFKRYIIEVLPFLVIGFLLSGLIHEFVPARLVERHLGGKGIKPILYSTLAGTILPICCIGSLPIALSLHQKGARLGPVLAFLVATPATSITALLVCYGLLGLKFTVFIFFAVILMGLLMGIAGNLIKFSPPKGLANPVCRQEKEFAIDTICGMSVDMNKGEKNSEKYVDIKEYTNKKGIKERLRSVFMYAFIDMVKKIGPEIFLGLTLAALVSVITPVGEFVGYHFSGGLGYLFSLVFGLAMYICSTALFYCQRAISSCFCFPGNERWCWDGAAYSRAGYQLGDYFGPKKVFWR